VHSGSAAETVWDQRCALAPENPAARINLGKFILCCPQKNGWHSSRKLFHRDFGV